MSNSDREDLPLEMQAVCASVYIHKGFVKFPVLLIAVRTLSISWSSQYQRTDVDLNCIEKNFFKMIKLYVYLFYKIALLILKIHDFEKN